MKYTHTFLVLVINDVQSIAKQPAAGLKPTLAGFARPFEPRYTGTHLGHAKSLHDWRFARNRKSSRLCPNSKNHSLIFVYFTLGALRGGCTF